jgi:hypothetical protein
MNMAELLSMYNYTNERNYDEQHPFFKWNHMYEHNPNKFCKEYPPQNNIII